MKASSHKTIVLELTPYEAYLLRQSLACCIDQKKDQEDNSFKKFSIEAIQKINKELENNT